jgi:hypothetical protein
MKKLKPPEFLSDLYADLRDRHLLVPALVLLVALVVVPTALSRSAETATPPAPGAAVDDDSTAVVPAVLADERSGVREYDKRLDGRKSKNPFQQHFTSVPKGDQLQGVSGVDAPSTSASAGGVSTAAGAAADTPSATSTESSSAAPPSPPTTTPTDPGHDGTHPDTHVFVHRIDVSVGTWGSMERVDNVKVLALLPSKSKPLLTFLGTNDGAKKALFSVSSDVDSVDTDGHCVPGQTNCRYLVLADGQRAKLHYALDDTTYRLRLLHVRTVELKGGHNFQLKQTTR